MSSYWSPGWREKQIEAFSQQQSHWDMVVIGGGITGAGVLLEAARQGLKVLLIEQKDFAWGTSSRSSKMVHGGLRYLATGQVGLTRDAVQEREQLLKQVPGLVEPLNFLMTHEKGQFPGPGVFNLVLDVYDWFSKGRKHRRLQLTDKDFIAPGALNAITGVSQFTDAITDDSRLVLRVLHEAIANGAVAINYLSADDIVREGKQSWVSLKDQVSGSTVKVTADVVVNATGVWTEQLLKQKDTKIRPLRGSHLVVPMWRLPVASAVSFFHPQDKRPVFAFPWEGMTLIGTTDLDHNQNINLEPSISQEEVDYLLEAANHEFPGAKVSENDVISSFSGVRPVVSSGALNPSEEKREHSIWCEDGTVSVAGGKLTTFRLIAQDVLDSAKKYLRLNSYSPDEQQIFKTGKINLNTKHSMLTKTSSSRLVGRYGEYAETILANAPQNSLTRVANTETLWAEIRWALANEVVVHLDDLLLRRTRLGLLLKDGASEVLAQLKGYCKELLHWDETRWLHELERYSEIIQRHYSLPKRALK